MSLGDIRGGERGERFEEWVETTRQVWDAFNGGDYERMGAFADPDVIELVSRAHQNADDQVPARRPGGWIA
jgi:hypothetical protein